VIVWSLMAPFAVMALGAELQVGTPDPDGSTVIEQALIEHVCGAPQTAGARGTDEYDACLSAQLLSLRADFGRDLSRLSASERKTLDSVCSNLRATRGRDAYVACLSAQLVSLRNRRNPANPAPPEATALPPPSVTAPSAGPAPPPIQASPWLSGFWIAATVVTLLVAAGGVLVAVKARRVPRKCRVCGTDLPESGDLCQKCRHEAAEAVRSAATERADQQRAKEGANRRQDEDEEEQRRQKTRQEEEARLRQEQEQEARVRQREEDARQRQVEETRQRSQVDAVSPEAFDPYAVLGVPPDGSKEDILAAYQAAKLKYDPDQVAHLSAEVRGHFKAKADAVDLAYKKITE
jgi:DnaJ-domain-containing protein 1